MDVNVICLGVNGHDVGCDVGGSDTIDGGPAGLELSDYFHYVLD